MSVAAKLGQAANASARRGVTVRFDPDWERRGRSGLSPKGHINHTTEDRRPVPWRNLLPILRNGHGRISGNAICNAGVPQNGDLYVIAAGLAWHAGDGRWHGWSGNSRFLGTEYQRGQGQPLTDAQQRTGRIWDEELARAFDYPYSMVCEHWEYAYPVGRKSDRRRHDGMSVSGTLWRASLGAQPAPSPADPELEELVEADMKVAFQLRGKDRVWLIDMANCTGTAMRSANDLVVAVRNGQCMPAAGTHRSEGKAHIEVVNLPETIAYYTQNGRFSPESFERAA